MICGKCGKMFEDGKRFCPYCGTPVTGQNGSGNNNLNNLNIIALVLGIVSIVLGVIGGITFGIFGALLGCAAGVVGLVFGIKVRKESGKAMGTSSFVCSLIGLCLSAFFFLGCASVGGIESCAEGTRGYTCYGCVGGSCMYQNDSRYNWRW